MDATEKILKFIKRVPLLEAIGADFIVLWGLPWAWKMLKGQAIEHFEHTKKKNANKFTFAEIMALLASKTETQSVHDGVIDFVRWFKATYPARKSEIDQFFYHHVSEIGEDGDIEDSRDFLVGLFRLPNHQARLIWLEHLGFLGPNARNFRERSLEVARDIVWAAYGGAMPEIMNVAARAWLFNKTQLYNLKTFYESQMQKLADYNQHVIDSGELEESRQRRKSAWERFKNA